jgi:hypothetical protein
MSSAKVSRLHPAILPCVVLAFLVAAVASQGRAASGAGGNLARVSVSSSGVQANGSSTDARISDDGRYILFTSNARNLVPGGTDGTYHQFLHDRLMGTTELISVSSTGVHGNDTSVFGMISSDGRYVYFVSNSVTLTPQDQPSRANILVRDRVAATTEWIATGLIADITPDGRYVLFNENENVATGKRRVYLRDRVTGTTEMVSVPPSDMPGFEDAIGGTVSADARFVTFAACAPNTHIRCFQTFVRDRQTGITERLSVGLDGTPRVGGAWPGQVTDDGRFVLFSSAADDLVVGDNHPGLDLFVHDRSTGRTELVDLGAGGMYPALALEYWRASADGRFVAFSAAERRPRSRGPLPVSQVYLHDRALRTTELVSHTASGTRGNALSVAADVSNDGRVVSFHSEASNLVEGDANGAYDVFVRDRPCSRACTTVTVTATAPTSTQCARGCQTVTATPAITATACSRGCTTSTSPNGSTTSSPAAGR